MNFHNLFETFLDEVAQEEFVTVYRSTSPDILIAFSTPRALLEYLHQDQGDYAHKDACLAAVWAQFKTRPEPAWKSLLLGALLPGLISLYRRSLPNHRGRAEDLWSTILLSCLETLCRSRRERYLFHNLLQDTAREVQFAFLHEDEPVPYFPAAQQDDGPSLVNTRLLLERAVAQGTLSEEDALLLFRTEIQDWTVEEVAKEWGSSPANLRKRKERALRKLRDFLTGEKKS